MRINEDVYKRQPLVLGLTRVEAAVMGSVLAAVSPAVVVPRMVQLMEEGRGTKQHIPQMLSLIHI